MRMRILAALAVWALMAAGPVRAAGVLTIGLTGDPGVLDPVRSSSSIDRNVLAALCDKLIDTDAEQHFVPDLATGWEWSADGLALTLHLRDGVKFQDGSAFDADAVRTNILREQTLTGSVRKGEVRAVASAEVVDPLTVRLHLSAPNAPLLAQLADRAGMMMSPTAIAARGDAISTHPVCSGPYAFTERVAQDHVTLDRFAGYWNAPAISMDRIVYRPIPDSTVRLVNLQSGQIQIADQLAPNDVAAVKGHAGLHVALHSSAGYRTLQFNLHRGPRSDTPLGRDVRVRMALDKAIDRQVINQVVFDGLFVANDQAEVPDSVYWDPGHPVPARDLDGAKALLKQAGVGRVSFRIQMANTPIDAQVGQVIQAMAAEAGFDVKLDMMETNVASAADDAGDYDAALLTWTGRADPDANLSLWMACDSTSNHGLYCNPKMDALLAQGRSISDVGQRVPIYRQIVDIYRTDLPQLILYNFTWIWGMSDRVQGFVPNKDGLIRPQGMTLAP